MKKKKDFMGRSSQRDYEMAEEYLNAPMAQPKPGMDVTEQRLRERIRREKMKESIQKMQDEIRYGEEMDFREARKRMLKRQMRREGF
jgi:hypothetical protein